MKIAFINDSSQQLGIQYMSAVLKQHGHEVKLFMDPQLFADDVIQINSLGKLFNYENKIVKDVKEFSPDLIGISIVTDFYQWACNIAQKIKAEIDTPIIVGGIHPTSVPDRVMNNKNFDMLCIGEGEFAMLELANSLEKGAIDYSIKNIWFRKGEEIIRNEVRPLISDLDALPMPDTDIYYSASPHFNRTGLYITMTSRGCSNACSYCCHSYLHELYKGKGPTVRQRSVNSVIEELDLNTNKHKIKFIAFMDNCFGYDLNWLKEFAREYKEKIGIKFWCIMHPNDVTEESVHYLKEAGCHTVDMGVQSWNEDLRKNILFRNIDNQTMENAIQLIKDANMEIMTDSIFDLPNQTDEDILKSAEKYIEIKPKRIYFYMLRHYPNTKMTRMAYNNNWLSKDRYEEVMDAHNVTSFSVGGDNVSKKLIKYQILFYLIDLLPRGISRFILKKKLYKYFPSFIGPALVVILRNLLAFDMNARLQRAWTINRYFHFTVKKTFNLKDK